MNMCGNEELRQTKSSTHALTTQNIDRQLSQPSDTFSFGMGETELLRYISAHLKNDKKVTLQGKDNLTIKIIGKEKLSWEKLIAYGETFIREYNSEAYKELFPNYPNLQEIADETKHTLDAILLEKLQNSEHDYFHLAIPEFLEDDKFSFTYSDYDKKNNRIYSHLDIEQLADAVRLDKLSVKKLKSVNVFAYSPEENRILSYKKWKLYDCIVGEIELPSPSGNICYILSNGNWRQVDADFYDSVNTFIENTLTTKSLPREYCDIDISIDEKSQNREEVFNNTYCQLNPNTVKFDQAKLRIGQSAKDKEFCDILEFHHEQPMEIIHVKKHGGSSALNYLFSQARFYCDAFLRDDVFLREIRSHISASNSSVKAEMLHHIKEAQSDVNGKDYAVGLWTLYDNKKPAPSKSDLPLMAKYELKLAYEQLRNTFNYSEVYLSMVPVEMTKYTKDFKKPT